MPLRPELYRQLVRVFHDVAIRNEGCQMIYKVAPNDYGEMAVIPDPMAVGEYYCVNCPYCGDTRKRLWFNYMWGVKLPELPNARNLQFALCYNEQCLQQHPERLDALFHDVFDQLNAAHDRVLSGSKTMTNAEFRWPGNVYRLNQLDQYHRANKYIRDRGFDPVELSTLFKVSYCSQSDPDFKICQDRIIIPIYQEAKPIGWQARMVGEPREPWQLKYYSMRGWHKGQCLYNYDEAKKYPTVVVCEGPLDVWKFGPEAICLFGKDISRRQLALLGEWRNIVLLLDGDVDDDKGLSKTRRALNTLHGRSRWVHVKMPTGVDDPAAMTRAAVRDLVYGEIEKAGF